MSEQTYGTDSPFFKMVDTIIKNIFKDLSKGKVDYDGSLALLSRQLAIAEKNNMHGLQGRIHHVMGVLNAERGQYQTGRGHFQSAVDIYQIIDFQSGISTMYCCLGEVCRELGETTEAAQYFHQSRDIAEQIDNTNMVLYNYANEGQLWLNSGDLERSLDLLRTGIAKADEELKKKWNEDWAYALVPEMRIALAETHARQNNFVEAWAEMERALKPAEERSTIHQLAYAHQVMALIAMAEKKPTATVADYFAQSRAYWGKMEASLDLARTLTLEGDFWIEQDDKKRATACYEEALTHYETANKLDEVQIIRAKMAN